MDLVFHIGLPGAPIRNRTFLLVGAAMQSHSNIFPRYTAIFHQIA
jgi:hypothetical protein